MPDLLSRARQKFALHGHKWTGQRREIVAVLDEDQSLHLSAEELHGILQERGQKIGLATVYRTLELMVDMGLIHSFNSAIIAAALRWPTRSITITTWYAMFAVKYMRSPGIY